MPSRLIRVFVSSPGDVDAERRRVERVVERLNGDFAGLAELRAVRWETRFYGAHATFQEQIPPSVECDIVVGIFWSRLGSELPPGFPPDPNGQPWASGTAYEILTAINQRRGGLGLPDIFLFRKTADLPLSTGNAEDRRETLRQLDLLQGFWQRWIRSEEGHFKAGFQSFETVDQFDEDVERLLRTWIGENVLAVGGASWPIALKGSPFRGLLPFGADHSGVFFGRARETRRGVDALKDADEAGCAALFIVGASGSGKSSLALAGILPRLSAPGVIPRVDAFRTIVMRPSDDGGAVHTLAQRLFATGALPELAEGDSPTPAALERLLAHGDETAARPLVSALDRAGRALREAEGFERPVRVDLLLLVDQLEELFGEGEAEREAFGRLLQALAATGRVWMVATLRADLYDRLLASDSLRGLKERGGSLDLSPPGPAELAEIVRGPARAAGLVFETDPGTQEALDDRILRDAAPDMLPLVQFTLQRLFENRESLDGTPILTQAVYDRLGGLDGALDTEAEKAMSALGSAEVAALPRLIRQLAAVDGTDWREPGRTEPGVPQANGGVTARPVLLAEVDPAAAELVAALVAARVLLADEGGSGGPMLRLAHERVLTAWRRAWEILLKSREFLRRRGDVETQRRRWETAGRSDDLLIPPGLALAEAEALLSQRDELNAGLVDFVEASRQADRQRQMVLQRRARRTQRLAVAAAFVLAVIAALAGWQWRDAYQARTLAEAATREATEQRRIAEENEKRAEAETLRASATAEEARLQTKNARTSFARFIATEAAKRAESDFDAARLLLLAVSPYGAHPDFPLVPAVIMQLGEVAEGDPLQSVLLHDGPVGSAVYSPDGSSILSTAATDRYPSNSSGVASIWDARTGALKFTIAPRVTEASWSPAGDRIATLLQDGTLELWDARLGAALWSVATEAPGFAAWSPDGRTILASGSHGLRVLDAETGLERVLLADGRAIGDEALRTTHAPAWSPDGLRIASVSAGGGLNLWDARTGMLLRAVPDLDSVVFLAWRADGNRLLCFSKDGRGRIVDAATGSELVNFASHQRGVEIAKRSPDGREIAILEGGKDVLVVNAQNGEMRFRLEGHDDIVTAIDWSPDGTKLVTSSWDTTVRVWDRTTGRVVTVLRGHGTDPETVSSDATGDFIIVKSASWSPDGRTILSSSADRTVRIWRLPEPRDKQLLRGQESADFSQTVIVDPSRTRLLSSFLDATRIRDARDGRLIATLTTGSSHPSTSGAETALAWSDGGRSVVGLAPDGVVTRWSLPSGAASTRGTTSPAKDSAAAWDADGRRVAFMSEAGSLQVWDGADGRRLVDMPIAAGKIAEIAWNAQATGLAAVLPETGSIALIDLQTSRYEIVDRRGEKPTRRLAWSPDGRTLVFVDDDGRAYVLSAKDCAVRRIGNAEGPYSIGGEPWRPDSRRLLLLRQKYGRDPQGSTVAIYDVAEDRVVAEIGGTGGWFHSVRWSPSGDRIATASSDNTAKVWNADDGALVASTEGPGGTAHSSMRSPEGSAMEQVDWDGDGRSLLVRSTRDGLSRWFVPRVFPPEQLLSQQSLSTYRLPGRTERDLLAEPKVAPAVDAAASEATTCDRLAAHPSDPRRLASRGVPFGMIDAVQALGVRSRYEV